MGSSIGLLLRDTTTSLRDTIACLLSHERLHFVMFNHSRNTQTDTRVDTNITNIYLHFHAESMQNHSWTSHKLVIWYHLQPIRASVTMILQNLLTGLQAYTKSSPGRPFITCYFIITHWPPDLRAVSCAGRKQLPVHHYNNYHTHYSHVQLSQLSVTAANIRNVLKAPSWTWPQKATNNQQQEQDGRGCIQTL